MPKPEHELILAALYKGCEDRKIVIVDCYDNEAGEPRAVICMIRAIDTFEELIPFAVLLEGDPYEKFTPPSSVTDLVLKPGSFIELPKETKT